MKGVLTLDKATVQEAEQVAQELDITVTEVYSQAIREFAASHNSVWGKIERRLQSLDNDMQGDVYEESYQRTKKILVQILRHYEPSLYPLIAVSDEGQIDAEWQDFKGYSFLFIEPVNEEEVNVQWVKIDGSRGGEKFTLSDLLDLFANSNCDIVGAWERKKANWHA
jgi:hypothetical protein